MVLTLYKTGVVLFSFSMLAIFGGIGGLGYDAVWGKMCTESPEPTSIHYERQYEDHRRCIENDPVNGGIMLGITALGAVGVAAGMGIIASEE